MSRLAGCLSSCLPTPDFSFPCLNTSVLSAPGSAPSGHSLSRLELAVRYLFIAARGDRTSGTPSSVLPSPSGLEGPAAVLNCKLSPEPQIYSHIVILFGNLSPMEIFMVISL